MAEKVLMIATVPSMIGQFNMNNIKLLQELGYSVDIATDFGDTSVWPAERNEMLRNELNKNGISCFQLDFSRNPMNIFSHIRSYKEVKKFLKKNKYSFVHTHTPIASAIVRMVAHKTKTKVIYSAHGFHFYKGAPVKNWLIFYPIEALLSRYTNVLITINQEDYNRAAKKFKAQKNIYIPGVGVDINRFAPRLSGRERIRSELGISSEQKMLLSTWNEDGDYETVIDSLKGMNITYVIVSQLDLDVQLMEYAKEQKVDLRLMGSRCDFAEFFDAADVFIYPTFFSENNIDIMEAMASGLPTIGTQSESNSALDEILLFQSGNVEDICKTIKEAFDERESWGKRSFSTIQSRDISICDTLISEITSKGYSHLTLMLDKQTKRKEIGVPIDAKILISVGELSKRKNHQVVVKALQNLPDDYWYVIVGKGTLKDKLQKLDHTGRLILLGFQSDIAELLKISDIFVFPSLQEGLPVALMEAKAAGLPCVASKIRGNIDLLQSGLVEKNSSDEWEREILNISLSNRGNKTSLPSEFSMVSIEEAMRSVYSQIDRGE